jgi:hypothetical protein
MCEILVKATDAHGDGTFKRGFPVVVVPDGHTWGAREGLPTFYVIKIPTLPVAEAHKYVERWTEGELLASQREWTIDVDLLPTAVLNTLVTTGTITIAIQGYNGPSDISWNQARNRFRNMKTGATA